MKIIFCGPPHSGKSVLIDCLRKLLPSDGLFIERIHLDGEGAWSNYPNQDMIQTVRKKQDYDINFINQKCLELRKYDSFPIVLVDIGGRLQDDKAPIFEACDAFVIISNDGEMNLKWLTFGTEHHCRCIANLYSVEHGTEEIFGFKPYLTGRAANLIRGQELPTQELITALADIIIKESNYTIDYQLAPGVLDFNKIAIELGLTNQRTTRFGQTVHFANFLPETAQQIYQYLKQNITNDNTRYMIYGARAVWLSGMTACVLKQQSAVIDVYDMTKMDYVTIRPLSITDKTQDDLIQYTVIDSDNAVFINVDISKPIFSDTEDYPKCTVPIIPVHKPLYISGRIPLWLLDSILISYDAPAKYVFQPGQLAPWICCYADDVSMIGTCLDRHPSTEVEQYFEECRKIKEEKRR